MDVVPVKNEEGAVIMFILDFQELRDRSQKRSGLRQRVARGWIYCACHAAASHDPSASPRIPFLNQQKLSVFRSEPAAEDEATGASPRQETPVGQGAV